MKRITQYVPDGYAPKWWKPLPDHPVTVNPGPDTSAVLVSISNSPCMRTRATLLHAVEFCIVASNPHGRREVVLDAIHQQLERTVARCVEARRGIDHQEPVVAITHRYHRELREAVTDRLPEQVRHDGPYLGGMFSVAVWGEDELFQLALLPDLITGPEVIRLIG